jgi:hypothetical protein
MTWLRAMQEGWREMRGSTNHEADTFAVCFLEPEKITFASLPAGYESAHHSKTSAHTLASTIIGHEGCELTLTSTIENARRDAGDPFRRR